SQAQAGIAPALVRTVEAPRHERTFVGRNSRSGVADAHDSVVAVTKQTQFDPPALRSKLHRIIDKIGNGLEQKIAVTVDRGVRSGANSKINVFVFRNRLVKGTDLAHDLAQGDIPESIHPAVVLDLGNAQQRCYDCKRLVESYERLVDAFPQLIEVSRFLPGALQRYPHAGERRAQIVCDVVAYSGQTADQNLDLTQHSAEQGRQFVEWVVGAAGRQPFSQLAGHDALDFAVDFLDASLRAKTQEHTDSEAQTQRRNQTHRQSAFHNVGYPCKFVITTGDDQGAAFGEPGRDSPNGVLLTHSVIHLYD